MNERGSHGRRESKCFVPTGAVQPASGVPLTLVEGFRRDSYTCHKSGRTVPVIMAAVTRDKLFDAFLDCVECLGDQVNVVIETSHHNVGGHVDLYCGEHENLILRSKIEEFRRLLLCDGCLGIAVFDEEEPREVQLEEHKLLVIFGNDLRPFERILHKYSVEADQHIRLVKDVEHVHYTEEMHLPEMQRLLHSLGGVS